MNIRNFAIFISIVIPLVCHSSDNIHLNSGEIIECNILTIDTTAVTAEIIESGIVRTFYKTEIKVIVYEDGTAEVFPIAKSEPTEEMKQRIDKLEKQSAAKTRGLPQFIAFCVIILLTFAII